MKECGPHHARDYLRCVPFELQLQVLDLSHNAIEDVDTNELPVTLVMLNLIGNPCCLHAGFRKKITSALMDLMVRPILPYTRVYAMAGGACGVLCAESARLPLGPFWQ